MNVGMLGVGGAGQPQAQVQRHLSHSGNTRGAAGGLVGGPGGQ